MNYIYGLHDRGGEHLLPAGSWVLVTEEIGHDPRDHSSADYSDLEAQGLNVLVRLNNAYGQAGTIPRVEVYDDFAVRVGNFVKNSKGCWRWIIGNEPNLEREQPRELFSNQVQVITPRAYSYCYLQCRHAVKRQSGHENDKVIVAPIGPWNGETPYDADSWGDYPANKIPGAPHTYPYYGFFGDYIIYLRDVLRAIGLPNCDGIALHAYTHGHDPALITSSQKMGPPFDKYHYHFLTYRDQPNILPPSYWGIPIYLTEVNSDTHPWPDINNGWVQAMYKEVDFWNQYSLQKIHCAILFRWQDDHENWGIEHKPQVIADFREAISQGYSI